MWLVVIAPSSSDHPVEHLFAWLFIACLVGVGEGVLELFRKQSHWPGRWGWWLLVGSLVGLGILTSGIKYIARNH